MLPHQKLIPAFADIARREREKNEENPTISYEIMQVLSKALQDFAIWHGLAKLDFSAQDNRPVHAEVDLVPGVNMALNLNRAIGDNGKGDIPPHELRNDIMRILEKIRAIEDAPFVIQVRMDLAAQTQISYTCLTHAPKVTRELLVMV